MDKLNDFFEKAHLILVFIVLSLFFTVIAYGMFNILGGFSGISQTRLITGSFAISLLMGGTCTGMIYLMRQAQKFYQDCNTLEDKVRHAKTRDELGELFRKDFTELRKRAFHQHMYSRLKEIHIFMTSIVGYLPNQNPES